MKKLVIALIIIVAVAAVAVITCPDKQSHKDAIMSVINEKINENLSPSEGDEGIALFGAALGSRVVEYVLDNRLSIKNHFLYSTGHFKSLEGEDNQVSVGVFGHVFTFKKEDLDEVMKEAI